jgi:hypothetical protein
MPSTPKPPNKAFLPVSSFCSLIDLLSKNSGFIKAYTQSSIIKPARCERTKGKVLDQEQLFAERS